MNTRTCATQRTYLSIDKAGNSTELISSTLSEHSRTSNHFLWCLLFHVQDHVNFFSFFKNGTGAWWCRLFFVFVWKNAPDKNHATYICDKKEKTWLRSSCVASFPPRFLSRPPPHLPSTHARIFPHSSQVVKCAFLCIDWYFEFLKHGLVFLIVTFETRVPFACLAVILFLQVAKIRERQGKIQRHLSTPVLGGSPDQAEVVCDSLLLYVLATKAKIAWCGATPAKLAVFLLRYVQVWMHRWVAALAHERRKLLCKFVMAHGRAISRDTKVCHEVQNIS